MASTPHQFPGTAGMVCNCSLPVKDKDSHTLCTNCCGKCCTAGDRCEDFHNWTDEYWEMVSAYHEKLAI